MRTLIFSDLHGHAWTEFATPVKYRGQILNSRLVDAARVIDWVHRMCIKHGVDQVVFGGDLFHRKRLIDVPVYNVITDALWRLVDTHVQVTLLAGNHDLTRRSAEGSFSQEHALFALGGHERIRVVDQPTVILDGLGLVPYASDRDTTLAGVETCMKEGARWLMMHAGVAGAVTGPVEYQPLEPVVLDDLPSVPLYSGHYHMPQKLDGRLTYIGAPLELVRGDMGGSIFSRALGRHRGAVLVDLHDPSKAQRLAYKKGPRFLQRRAWELSALETVAGNFIDLQVRDTKQIEPATAQLMAAGARAVNPVFVHAPERTQARLKVKLERNGLPTVESLCRQLVDTADPELDHDLLWQLAQEALHAADTTDIG